MGFAFLAISCKPAEKEYHPTTDQLHTEAMVVLEKEYREDLLTAAAFLDSIAETQDISQARAFYLIARKAFKRAEPILSFQDYNNYYSLNAPDILKVDEESPTDIKEKKPIGFQVIEENLMTDEADLDYAQKIARTTAARLMLAENTTGLNHYKPYHVLWLVRQQLLRTALTGTTGFDSPVLEQSLEEGIYAFAKAEEILHRYNDSYRNQELVGQWKEAWQNARGFMTDSEYATFDHFAFIKDHIDPMLQLWNRTVDDLNIEFPLEMAVSNDAEHIFSNEFLNLDYFADASLDLTLEKTELGQQLFYDTRLSTSGSVSCATCHKPSLAFTDGRVTPDGLDRNSPTLNYAAYQQGFFYDRRAGSLEGQIISVIENEKEFHTNLEEFAKRAARDSSYVEAFATAYKSEITDASVRTAIADYVRTLNPWDSKFDQNMRGERNDLTAKERLGFNLFMGKAKCATCHFAPVFNGTVPPNFAETEMEHLGVPETVAWSAATIDSDPGRYNLYKTESRRHFFKTPTVRNTALTAPYMHNGVYQNLDQVLKFYNLGGGAGIGIEEEFQTLPPDPLNLTEDEIQAIIAFMESLTDEQKVDYAARN
jgi:cytochrome c peroxidase